jgi:histone H3/H4
MITLNYIRRLTKNFHKKIGNDALNELENILKKDLEDIIKKAAKNADFSGRITIKPADLILIKTSKEGAK